MTQLDESTFCHTIDSRTGKSMSYTASVPGGDVGVANTAPFSSIGTISNSGGTISISGVDQNGVGITDTIGGTWLRPTISNSSLTYTLTNTSDTSGYLNTNGYSPVYATTQATLSDEQMQAMRQMVREEVKESIEKFLEYMLTTFEVVSLENIRRIVREEVGSE